MSATIIPSTATTNVDDPTRPRATRSEPKFVLNPKQSQSKAGDDDDDGGELPPPSHPPPPPLPPPPPPSSTSSSSFDPVVASVLDRRRTTSPTFNIRQLRATLANSPAETDAAVASLISTLRRNRRAISDGSAAADDDDDDDDTEPIFERPSSSSVAYSPIGHVRSSSSIVVDDDHRSIQLSSSSSIGARFSLTAGRLWLRRRANKQSSATSPTSARSQFSSRKDSDDCRRASTRRSTYVDVSTTTAVAEADNNNAERRRRSPSMWPQLWSQKRNSSGCNAATAAGGGGGLAGLRRKISCPMTAIRPATSPAATTVGERCSTSSLGSSASSTSSSPLTKYLIGSSPSPPTAVSSINARRRHKKSCPLLPQPLCVASQSQPAPPIVFVAERSRSTRVSFASPQSPAPAYGGLRNSSPAADTGKRRRSVRKQRYYGSVEMMVSVDASGQVRNMGRFRMEPGVNQPEPDVYQGDSEIPTSPIMVEDPEVETRWYFRHFLGREHQNFAGVDNQKAPFFLSVSMEDGVFPDGLRCRAILWAKSGSKKLVFPYYVGSQVNSVAQTTASLKDNLIISGVSSTSPSVNVNSAYQKPLTARSIVQKFPGMIELSHGLKEITDPKLQKDLLILEEQEGAVNFKFGVIYVKHGQEADDDMLSNESGSSNFEEFLQLLGDHVTLQGWNKFRGGLDTKTNSTGNESVYTVYEGHEIMFHVSTLLPYSTGNKQQVERKRHIGNDIVNIVFEDGGDPANPSFNPTAMKSQFTHIFAVVTYDRSIECYRLWVFSEESVPAYGPCLPNPPEFYNKSQFRDFILTKLINGEKAAFRSRVFAEKRYRTMDTLIKDMYMEYLNKELSKGSLHKVTEAVVRHLRSPKSKEFDHNLVEFVRMGEHLKLTKSMSGEAPNILAVNSLYRKQPWEPQLLCQDMPLWESLSSDSWGNRSLTLVTEECGVLFVNEGVCTPLFDVSCQIQQLNVLENFGLLIVRCEKGKDAYISVFSLNQMRACIRAGHTLNRKQCMEYRVPNTKGCHLYAISGNNSLRLSVALCIGKKLAVLRWNSSQMTTQLSSSSEIAKNFDLIKEISLPDEPLALCLFESGLQANIKACSVSKNGLDLADINESSITNLHKCSITRNSLTSLIASCDVESEDILLTFDNTTLVFDLCEEESEPLAISWTANPRNIAYCFPFVLSFTTDTIEIRLAVNGNLFTSLYMPGVRLLAAKEDIFFTIDRLGFLTSNNNDSPKSPRKNQLHETKSPGGQSSSSASASAAAAAGCSSSSTCSSSGGGNTSANVTVAGTNSTSTMSATTVPKRWAKLYKIPIKNLLRNDNGAAAAAANNNNGRIGGATTPLCPALGTTTTTIQEGVVCPPSSMSTVGRSLLNAANLKPPVTQAGVGVGAANAATMTVPAADTLTRGSLGSDSGWSSSQSRYSTASSFDVDVSSPPSPGGADSSGDVLL